MARREQALTAALRNDEPTEFPMPEHLRQRLDATILAEGDSHSPPARILSIQAWGLAAAAIAVFGATVFFMMPEGGVFLENERPSVALDETPPPEATAASAEDNPPQLNRGSLAGDLLLEPLAAEQARLASDMTHALQFFASSVLPETYARQVNDNLESLQDQIGKPI